MSGQRGSQRQSSSRGREGEQQQQRVFCHTCRHEWNLDSSGLECPECQSDIVEIIEPDQAEDPRAFDESTRFPFQSTIHWSSSATPNAPDPDEDDIGNIHFGARPSPFGGTFYNPRPTNAYPFGYQGGARGMPFDSTHVLAPLATVLQTITQSPQQQQQQQQQRRTSAQHMFGRGMGPGVPFRPQSAPPDREAHETRHYMSFGGRGGQRVERVTVSTGPNFSFTSTTTTSNRSGGGGADETTEAGVRDLQQMIDSIFNASLARDSGGARGIHGHGGGGGAQFSDPIAALLSTVMQMGAGHGGDTVRSQEEFDRVMSRLMEEHTSGSAPGPASQAAIAALPRKSITKDMLDENTGKAECSICMDEVDLGEEVAELPCHHWFHHACAEAWLKEHDTCPVCRAGIMPKEGSRESVRSPGQMPLHDQDPFLLARQESASRDAQFLSPSSPGGATMHPSSPGARRLSRNSLNTMPQLSPSVSQQYRASPPSSASASYSSRPQSERRRHSSSATRRPSNADHESRSSSRYEHHHRQDHGANNNTSSSSSSSAAVGAVSGFLERARNFLSGGGAGASGSSSSHDSSRDSPSGSGNGAGATKGRRSSNGTSRR